MRELEMSCERTEVFARMGARARNEEAQKIGGAVSRPRKKSTGEEKKNRRSVGKRNYRLMRRSFRHAGFERESAIGRCFFAQVIRVFARSLSHISALLYLSRSLARFNSLSSLSSPEEALRVFMIYPPPDVYWKARWPTTSRDRVRIR